MPINRRLMLSASTLGVLAAPSIRPASAQTWPARPIEWVVPFGPGGADVLARTLAPFLEKHIGNDARIGVVNRTGAGGEIGFTAIATARPDGYTIGNLHAPAFLTIPHERRARFNFDSFTFIGNVETEWASLFVAPESPFRTIQDLVEFGKANPRRITVGLPGLGTAMHLAALAFSRAAGIEFTLVPFAGGGLARAAMMGGHINAATFGTGDGVSFVRDGQIRILGTMANTRSAVLPDAPTMREQGIDVVAGTDRGLAAPAGIPPAVMERLSDALASALRDPEFVATARERGMALNYMTSADFRAHLVTQREAIATLWRTNPWRQ